MANRTAGGVPFFLYAYPQPDVASEIPHVWLAFCIAFGTLHSCTAFLIVALSLWLRHHLKRKVVVTLLCVTATLVGRAVFFFADPYHQQRSLPPVLTAYLYGIAYPASAGATCIAFLALFGVVEKSSRASSAGAVSVEWVERRTLSRALIAVCVVELLVQIFTDTARSGFHRGWEVLTVCRIFFVCWGGGTAAGFFVYAVRLYLLSSRIGVARTRNGKSRTGMPLRILIIYLTSTVTALVLSVLNAAALALPQPASEAFVAFHSVENALIVINAAAMAILFLPAAWQKARRHGGWDDHETDVVTDEWDREGSLQPSLQPSFTRHHHNSKPEPKEQPNATENTGTLACRPEQERMSAHL